MRSTRTFPLTAVALVAASGLAFAPTAQGPRVTIGTLTPGSLNYAVGDGLAKVVSAGGQVNMTVQPYTGTRTFITSLNTGELPFAVMSAVDVALAYRGPQFKIGGRNPFPASPDIRLVMRGAPLAMGLLVQKNSPIRNVHQIKGKRLTGDYPGQAAVFYSMVGHLASAGLTW